MSIYDLPSEKSCPKIGRSVNGTIIIVILLAMVSNANAACSLGGCSGNSGDWESTANSFLNSEIPGSFIASNAINTEIGSRNDDNEAIIGDHTSDKFLTNTSTGIGSSSINHAITANRSDEFVNGGFLEPMMSISGSEILIDASNADSDHPHIKGAIHLPSKSFLYGNKTLRPRSELAGILGMAGISNEDKVVMYGTETASADSTFFFWIMRYLGDDNASVMDGGLSDWVALSLPLESKQNLRGPRTYKPLTGRDILANYSYVKSKKVQLVDSRDFQDFVNEHIPGSISIESSKVLDNGSIKNAAQLKKVFFILNKDRPIVVYSDDLLNASLVWYGLQLMGYDSRLYSWDDWHLHQRIEGFRHNATMVESTGAKIVGTAKYRKLG